jgi:hypothetical protein
MCGIIDVVGVGLDRMVWVLWMGYAIKDITPIPVMTVQGDSTGRSQCD